MMMSPERFIEEHKNKSYTELLSVRDRLFEEIRAFENHTYNPKMDMFDPSPEVVYLWDLEYMGILCELIAEKFNRGE